MPSLLDLLRCPRCRAAPLTQAGAAFTCAGCSTRYPSIDRIPWLFPEPEAALGEWRRRTQFFLQHLEREAARVRGELDASGLRASTRTRLKLLAAAYEDQARRIRALLAPLDLDRPALSFETHLALKTRLPESQALTSYYANLHRDWCWGEEENEASFALVAQAFADARPGASLVLGAGAGRLALDIHTRLAPDITIAADINPLLLLTAAKATRGEKVVLYEFPIAPKSADSNAVLRTLSSRVKADARFHLLFADAMHDPFAPASFDSVVTPWFIDIVPEDFEQLARRLSAFLREGGVWVNMGSLAFAQPESARSYGLEEVAEILRDSGFEIVRQSETLIPYMRSPASRHSRMESVVAFAAYKRGPAPPPAPGEALPAWLIDAGIAVPALPSFQTAALTTRIHAHIMSLIDGRRSLQAMADVLVQQRLMTQEDAQSALREFLIKMYEESRQPRRF